LPLFYCVVPKIRGVRKLFPFNTILLRLSHTHNNTKEGGSKEGKNQSLDSHSNKEQLL
jgi:hypothetical protein